MKLHLEYLESREVPAAFAALQGDILAVALVGSGPHAAVLSQIGESVRVDADFATWMFPEAKVKQVVILGAQDAQNFIFDKLDLPALILGGSKADAIVTTGAKASVFGGGGLDFFAVQSVDPPALTASQMFTPTTSSAALTGFLAAPTASVPLTLGYPSEFTDLFGPATG